MTMEPTEPDNVIALNKASVAHLEILKKARAEKFTCYGIHKRVVVDSETRTVECATCGRIVDAFDYLEQWATEGDRRMEELKAIRVQIKIANTELRDLGRKLNNMRGALKRGGQPQTKEERAVYSVARWNPLSPKTQALLDGRKATD